MTRLTCILLACWMLPQTAGAEVYKWVDESGKTHFGDKAPEKSNAEDISQSVEKTNLDTSVKNTAASLINTDEKTQDEIDLENQKNEEKQAAIAAPCKRLKKDIDMISAGKRVAFYDENGKEYTVLEKDRGKELEERKAIYKKMGCK